MSADHNEESADAFAKVDGVLAQLRTAINASTPEPGWLKKTLADESSVARQNDFNRAIIEAVSQLAAAMRDTATRHEGKLDRLAQELSELRAVTDAVDSFRESATGVERELRAAAANIRGLQERAAALESELAGSRNETAEKIQHVLDEQRVCIRQLALKTSEEAVLADRARRATELKLEDLAKRVPPRPA